MTFSHIGVFSPSGQVPLTTSKTADEATSAAGETNGYTITISNTNGVDVTVNSIIDDLPTGFTVVAGSTTGATTDDPTVADQTLTWSGPFTVTANSSLGLSFNVTVPETLGTYFNNATAEAENYIVIPTGDSAPITVTVPVPATPEIDVQGNSTSIADGDSSPDSSDHTDFGSTGISSGTVSRTFTISNIGKGPLALNGSPLVELSPTGAFTVTTQPTSPIAGGTSSDFVIQFAPTITGVHSTTVTIANDDADENPYTFVIGGSGVTPEIDVSGNEESITDGDTTASTSDNTDFGNVEVNSNITPTFTISNMGTLTLNLSLPVTLSPTGYFTVTNQPSPTIAPGQVSTFTVTFRPTAPQLYTATVSIVNNDLDENPYDFVIQGTGTSPSTPTNQPPQLDTPIPDITVTEGAADQTLNLLDYFSDPEGDLLFFKVMENSNREVAPSMSPGQTLLSNLLTLQFGTAGQTEIVILAEEDVHHQTYQDSFTITVLEAPSPTLSMSQTVSDNEVEAGQEITYTTTITNSGPGTATNAQISNALPAGLTFVDGSISATGLGDGTLGTSPPTLASGVTLAANQSLEISFAATVNQDVVANHMMTNTVELTADEMSTAMQASSMIMVIAPDSTLDQDIDGVNDDIEAAVNDTGDGNNDGTPDNEQQHVASLPNSTNGDYLTLFFEDDNFELVDVKAIENPAANLPDGVEFPQGFLEFNIAGVEPGESVELSVIWHSEESNNWPNSYWKYGPTPDDASEHWYNFEFDDITGAEMGDNSMTLYFVDGARGDSDLEANGQIADPGGLAIYSAPTALTLSDMSSQAPITRYAGALLALLMVAGLFFALRRKEE